VLATENWTIHSQTWQTIYKYSLVEIIFVYVIALIQFMLHVAIIKL